MKRHTVRAQPRKLLYLVGFTAALFYCGLWGANNDLFFSYRQPQKTQLVARNDVEKGQPEKTDKGPKNSHDRRASDGKDAVKGLVAESRSDFHDLEPKSLQPKKDDEGSRKSGIKLRASGDKNETKGAVVESRNDDQRSRKSLQPMKGAMVESRVDGQRTRKSVQPKSSGRSDNKRKASGDKGGAAKGTLIDNTSDGKQRTVLMVVAHPDDDVLWGGEFLLKEGHKAHVVVTSTQNNIREVRFEEFTAVQQHLGTHGEFLNGTDSPTTMVLESDIKKRIQNLVCSKDWERIVTHGPEGEYGHPQHHLVHDAVLEAVRRCCFSADKLYVFHSRPVEKYVFPEAKTAVAKLYKSQAGVIFKTFGRWKEQIVPLKDYDYKAANEICRKGHTQRPYRQCRLHKMLDFSDPNYRKRISFSDQGIGCVNHQVTQDPASTKMRLETPCGKDEARVFVTFAVLREPGRWHVDDGARAIRILYSSLVRTHGCAVQLHVHTNMVRFCLTCPCFSSSQFTRLMLMFSFSLTVC